MSYFSCLIVLFSYYYSFGSFSVFTHLIPLLPSIFLILFSLAANHIFTLVVRRINFQDQLAPQLWIIYCIFLQAKHAHNCNRKSLLWRISKFFFLFIAGQNKCVYTISLALYLCLFILLCLSLFLLLSPCFFLSLPVMWLPQQFNSSVLGTIPQNYALTCRILSTPHHTPIVNTLFVHD